MLGVGCACWAAGWRGRSDRPTLPREGSCDRCKTTYMPHTPMHVCFDHQPSMSPPLRPCAQQRNWAVGAAARMAAEDHQADGEATQRRNRRSCVDVDVRATNYWTGGEAALRNSYAMSLFKNYFFLRIDAARGNTKRRATVATGRPCYMKQLRP